MVTQTDPDVVKKARFAALVIIGTMMLWSAAQYVDGAWGIAQRFQLLIDLLAMTAFMWAIVVIYQIWRARRAN
jgi:hypothetical protein